MKGSRRRVVSARKPTSSRAPRRRDRAGELAITLAAAGPADDDRGAAAAAAPSSPPWGVLEALLDQLESRPLRQLGEALGGLAVAMTAGGAALIDRASHPALVVAAWGELPAPVGSLLQQVRSASSSLGDGGGWWTSRSDDGRQLVGYQLPALAGESLMLLLWDAPVDPGAQALLRVAARLLAHVRRRERAARRPHRGTAQGTTLQFPEHVIVGRSPLMQRLYGELERVVDGDFPVLLLGETGVGKEHLAHLLHASSRRAAGPFVAINCAAIPGDLLEAELFGIGRGVATGVSERAGKFREAAGGTLLLDEIAEIPLALQSKLLRALAEKEVRPLGSGSTALAARVLAATNQDLPSLAAQGRFRADLYYRLAGWVARVPPLRQRREDLPVLVEHFLDRFSRELERDVRGMTGGALERLSRQRWPGNVRELEHVVRRLVLVCPPGGVVDEAAVAACAPAELAGSPEPSSLRLVEHERSLVLRALERCGGNRSAAARLLGISRSGLLRKLKRLNVGGSVEDERSR